MKQCQIIMEESLSPKNGRAKPADNVRKCCAVAICLTVLVTDFAIGSSTQGQQLGDSFCPHS